MTGDASRPLSSIQEMAHKRHLCVWGRGVCILWENYSIICVLLIRVLFQPLVGGKGLLLANNMLKSVNIMQEKNEFAVCVYLILIIATKLNSPLL